MHIPGPSQLDRDDWNIYLSITVFFLICLAPIMFPGHYLYDDVGRSIEGYYDWTANGRPFSDLIYFVLMRGSATHDIAPLPQLLSVLSIGAAALFLRRAFREESTLNVFLLGSMVFAVPTYLENFSYNYDSFSYTISALLALAAACVGVNGWKLVLSATLLLLSLLTYQAAINVYFVASLGLFAFYSVEHNSTRYTFILRKTAVAAVCLVFYLATSFFYPYGNYEKQHNGLVSLSHPVAGILRNIREGFSQLYSTLALDPVLLIIVIAVIAFPVLALLAIFAGTRRRSPLEAALALLFAILAIIGVQIVLKSPVWHARTYLGLGAACTISTVISLRVCQGQVGRSFARILALGLMFCFLTTTYSLGAFLKNVRLYQQSAVPPMAAKINRVAASSHASVFAIWGQEHFPTNMQMTLKAVPILSEINNGDPIYNGWWGYKTLVQYGLNQSLIFGGKKDWSEVCRLLPAHPFSSGYEVVSNGKTVFLVFPDGCPQSIAEN